MKKEKLERVKDLVELKNHLEEEKSDINTIEIISDCRNAESWKYKNCKFSREKHEKLFKKIVNMMLKEIEAELDNFIIISPEEQEKSNYND